ncbi:hypothetical protein [Rhizobium sp.]
MTLPMPETPPSNMPVVLRIILAVLCLLPSAVGLLIILVITGAFVIEGFGFRGDEAMWMQAFLAGAGFLALPPAIVIGIILRYARWKRATSASLVLAVIVGAATALASGVIRTTIAPDDSESYITLLMFSLAALVTGALPPFLHWWNARDIK